MNLTAIFILTILCILVCVCNLILFIVFASKRFEGESESSSTCTCSGCTCSSEDVELTEFTAKFYVTCVCSKTNKARVYRSFLITWNTASGEPSEDDLKKLRSEVLAANPDYNECVILFFGKLEG